MHAAREAKARADHVRRVIERGQARLREVEQARRDAHAEVDREIEDARLDAEAAKQTARERADEAARKLTEATRLLNEEGAPQRRSAKVSSCPAWQLTHRALELDTAEVQTMCQRPVVDPDRQLSSGNLGYHTRAELIVLAAKLGVKKPANLTKSQLSDEVAKASRSSRSQR